MLGLSSRGSSGSPCGSVTRKPSLRPKGCRRVCGSGESSSAAENEPEAAGPAASPDLLDIVTAPGDAERDGGIAQFHCR